MTMLVGRHRPVMSQARYRAVSEATVTSASDDEDSRHDVIDDDDDDDDDDDERACSSCESFGTCDLLITDTAAKRSNPRTGDAHALLANVNHSGTLVPSSVNGDIVFLCDWPKFDPLPQNPNPLTDYDKTVHS